MTRLAAAALSMLLVTSLVAPAVAKPADPGNGSTKGAVKAEKHKAGKAAARGPKKAATRGAVSETPRGDRNGASGAKKKAATRKSAGANARGRKADKVSAKAARVASKARRKANRAPRQLEATGTPPATQTPDATMTPPSTITTSFSRIKRNVERAEQKVLEGKKRQVPPGLMRVLEKFAAWLGIDLAPEPPVPPVIVVPEEPTSSVEPTVPPSIEPTAPPSVEPTAPSIL